MADQEFGFKGNGSIEITFGNETKALSLRKS
jgi:hypothetical protein